MFVSVEVVMVKPENREFDTAMMSIYQTAKSELGYNAKVFFRMLCEKGGVLTAKQLINSPTPSEGYAYLYEAQRLDLSVEAQVVENKQWHSLFSAEELERARDRLKKYGYPIR
jgi:hypothetical protein